LGGSELSEESMASKREVVRLSGRLVGMGHDVECSVQAVKVSLPGTAEFNYAGPHIYDVPPELPDSLYSLMFGGRTERVQRHCGAWIAPVA
jgi:hypothetical protein